MLFFVIIFLIQRTSICVLKIHLNTFEQFLLLGVTSYMTPEMRGFLMRGFNFGVNCPFKTDVNQENVSLLWT